MHRDWIIETLGELPVWCWPVFLWHVMVIRHWLAGLPPDTKGTVRLTVTIHGEIYVSEAYEEAEPFWTPQPWKRLGLDVIEGALAPFRKREWRPAAVTLTAHASAPTCPAIQDSG